MENLVLQVDIKDFNHLAKGFWKPYHRHEKLYADSKDAATKYASKLNADYFCLSSNMLGDYSPTYQKLSLYYFFEYFNYNKIFLLDADAVISQDCPNIFEHNTISAVTNGDDNQLLEHGIPENYNKFFCSGVLLLTRDFYDLTKNYWLEELNIWNKKNHVGFHDQSVLNCLAYKYYPHNNINILPNEWGAWWQDSKYINHYSDIRKNNYKTILL